MSTTAVTTPPGLAAPPEALDDDPPVRMVMRPLGPIEVPATMRVIIALDRLKSLGTGHLLIRRHGHVRAVAEVDLLRHLLEGRARPSHMLNPVSDVSTPVTTVGPEMRRSQAAEQMLPPGRPVLVVVADGKPCGLLDPLTVLHSVARHRR